METNSELSSKFLFHYTDEFEKLISIINDGFRPNFSLEQFNYFENLNGDKEIEIKRHLSKIAFHMVCFCDIPINLTKNHRDVYGDYAIGLTKTWGMEHKITPLWYLPNESAKKYFNKLILRSYEVDNIINSSNDEYLNNIPEYSSKIEPLLADIDEIISLTKQLYYLTKPYIGPFKKESTNFFDPEYVFYNEREWRYLPEFPVGRNFYTEIEHSDKKSLSYENAIQQRLEFDINDIKQFFVCTETERKELLRILKKKFGDAFNNLSLDKW